MVEADNRLVKLSQDDERRIGKLAGYLSLAAKIGEKYEKSKFKDVIEAVAPWSQAFGEVIPPLKLLGFVLERISRETDPVVLGGLACTMAYEKAAKQALDESAGPEEGFGEVKRELALLEPREEADMSTFSLERALSHEFISRADLRFQAGAQIAGYTAAQVERLTARIHELFPGCLDRLLTDAETGKKFAPFREYLELGSPQRQEAFRALQQHLNYQRWLFEEAPVLGKSPFALKHVYVEIECGKLTWGEIQRGKEEKAEAGRAGNDPVIDPASEGCGGRLPLLETVMDLIGDLGDAAREPIIIQGAAGAGKSSFTLRLCDELRKNHLRPIWVRLKDLDLTRDIEKSLPAAVRLADEPGFPAAGIARPRDLFLGGQIFSERGLGRYKMISRYVLILDAWDEISVSDAGFQRRVNRMLEQVRRAYLGQNDPPLRVVMTGRPAKDVTESTFLNHDQTPILTIRPLSPPALSEYIGALAHAVRERPIPLESGDEDLWPAFEPSRFESLLERYEQDFSRLSADETWAAASSRGNTGPGALAVLGLPLLAYLTIRLISEWQGEPGDLVSNPTALYRNLVDLTCEKGGKAVYAEDDPAEVLGQHRVVGWRLRELLQQTAAAMSVLGQDIIAYDELKARLKLEGDRLGKQVDDLTREHSLSSLMISFYFKGGYEHLGCEFLHKSFREYLFAEAIVAALKYYGGDPAGIDRRLGEREEYWRDFEQRDPRHAFSRQLAELLAPQWLTPEVSAHIEELVAWEIGRLDEGPSRGGRESRRLDAAGWERVREGLADLWDWWGEGVHLRPQAVVEGGRQGQEPYTCKLIERSAPLVTGGANPRPARTTTMDAHLGDGLCRLCALVHYRLAARDGYRGHDGRPLQVEGSPRRYQRKVVGGQGEWLLFAPSGPSSKYFRNYINRINSAGWRPSGDFPGGVVLSGVVLSDVLLPRAVLLKVNLSRAILYGASLERASLDGASLDGASLDGANLDRAILDWVSLNSASLDWASLDRASLDRAILDRASLDSASLDWASLFGTSLKGARLDGAGLDGARLTTARLDGARLDGASLHGTILYAASLVGASLVGASLDGASLNQARLDRAGLDRASLDQATLKGASLKGASLEGARLDGARLDGARLDGASLLGAKLSEAIGCTWDQIEGALIDEHTELPPEFEEKRDAKLRAQHGQKA